jgi:hypothetical protein
VIRIGRVEAGDDLEGRVMDLEEITNLPGTYFNPQTEVLVVVDDSASIDQEIFNMEAYEGVDWVRISDEVPIDEEDRDRLLEEFQTEYHPGASESVSETTLEPDDDELDDEEDELEGDEEGEPAGDEEAKPGGEED